MTDGGSILVSEETTDANFFGSSVRSDRAPPMPRRLWILGFDKERIQEAREAVEAAGHQVRACEPGGELGNTIRDFRPDVIVIDMQEFPDRGRHAATQLRADRATRQLPIILVSVDGEEIDKTDKAVTGPTRRYTLPLNAPSVLSSIIVDL